MENWFNSKKAAQVAAFFCDKQGGLIPALKLVKLVYLSDRKFLSDFGFTITNDLHVSMPHGPVNSLTYEYVGGNRESEEWSALISDREGHNVALARPIGEADTDELSDAEIDVMNSVWQEFGQMGKYAIRDWTHDNCPEWEDPHGSSSPIPLERTLRFLGVENAELFAKRTDVYREFRSALSDLQSLNADSPW